MCIRDSGKIKVNEAGNPIKVTGNNTLVGNANPDALLGWSNTFTSVSYTHLSGNKFEKVAEKEFTYDIKENTFKGFDEEIELSLIHI